MRIALPASPSSDTVWSMPPVGAPAASDSARTLGATRSRTSRPRPAASVAARATEQISAAELDSPEPRGTRPSTSRSSPGTSWPASRSAHTAPAA